MRTRRRPVLQDKTPGNTPQKPKTKSTRSAKPTLVPVVEIKSKPRRTGKALHAQGEERVSATREEGERILRSVAPCVCHKCVPTLEGASATTEAHQHEATPPKIVPRKRGRPRKEVKVGEQRVETERRMDIDVGEGELASLAYWFVLIVFPCRTQAHLNKGLNLRSPSLKNFWKINQSP